MHYSSSPFNLYDELKSVSIEIRASGSQKQFPRISTVAASNEFYHARNLCTN